MQSKDAKFQKVALEGLYRLLWIYVVRVKCADNVTTKKYVCTHKRLTETRTYVCVVTISEECQRVVW